MCIRKAWPSIISNETRSDPYFRPFYFFSIGGYGLFMLEKFLGAYKLPSREHNRYSGGCFTRWFVVR